MSASVQKPATTVADPHRAPVAWIATIGSGLAVVLAGAPVTAVVQSGWLGYAVAVVAVVVAAGLLLHRVGPPVVAIGQGLAILVLLTVLFADDGVLEVFPGPGAWREFRNLIAGAGRQIDVSTAPVPGTPEILFLVTAAFGLLAVAVHLAAVSAAAPAAGGLPLLAVFAVPAALADDLLPWWAMASAAAGFGLLLVARDGPRRQLPGGAALVAGAVVLALGIGAAGGMVGTAGRFGDGDGGGGAGGSIGLSPFAALRGQLDRSTPVELFRVSGLTRPTYLRALTLQQYVPEAGWQASRPVPGTPLPGSIQPEPGVAGDLVDVEFENVAFRDYWLPLYGLPLDVSGLTESQWLYDPASGTGYTSRPRQEDGWQQRALLPSPSADTLRGAPDGGTESAPGGEYLDTTGVDRRVADIAQQVVAGRGTDFDRALALQDFFTAPGSEFRYRLETAPGSGDDALVEFLTIGRVGYCEQFASAMAVMLRTVGVPARVAVGFTAGTQTGDRRSISTSDAHAWVEAWFPGIGWTTFDPTPLTDGRSVTPSYVLEARAESAEVDGAAAGDVPVEDRALPQPAPAPVAEDPLGAETAGGPVADADGLPLWPLVVVALLVLIALGPAVVRAVDRRRRLATARVGGPDAAGAAWSELLAESADRGVPSPASDTVRGAARRLVREHRLDPAAQQALRTLVGAVESSWYGGDHPGAGDLDEPGRAARAGIASGTALPMRARLLPPSVMARHRLLGERSLLGDGGGGRDSAATSRSGSGR